MIPFRIANYVAKLAIPLVMVAATITSALGGVFEQPPNAPSAQPEDRPNILWLSTEDIGPELNCYGDSTAKTPTLDKLASRGVVYDYAWSNYPVCAPARTTIIAGMYASCNGAGNMRSSVPLPKGVDAFPHYLRQAGYYCTNNSKTDYNYNDVNKNNPWDESSKKAHYRNRKPGQPFFAVFNYTGTHESKIRKRPHKAVIDPASVKVKSYWPDRPEVRQDLAQYYDNLQVMDEWIAKRLKELDKSGEADNTIVIFFGDHGSGMPRHKRFAGDSGMRVPMVVHVPKKWKNLVGDDYKAGGRSKRMVGFVDLAPTMLSLAGIQPKEFMHGSAFLGTRIAPAQKYLYGFRDRMDERPDVSRSIRNERFLYVRNYMPHLPAGQHVNYQMQTPTTRVWKEMFDQGKLNDVQKQFWMPRAAEELYDLEKDPEETVNLANQKEFQSVLEQFREEHQASYMRFGDLGLFPEATICAIAQKGDSPRTMLDYPEKYKLPTVFQFANLVSADSPDRTEATVACLKSTDPTLNYWGAVGCLIDANDGFQAGKDHLLKLIDDDAPAASIAACEVVARYGSEAECDKAIRRLAYFANYENSNVFGAVAALNVIDRLGDKADPIREDLKSVPDIDPSFKRGKDYIKRMLIAVGAAK